MSKFKLKDNIDIFLYNIFNFFSDLFYAVTPGLAKKIESNKKFKNKHKGERCFILGTGPSLNDLSEEVFSILSKEVTFGVNSFYKSRFVSILSPNYYVLVDTKYRDTSSAEYLNIAKQFSVNPPVLITDYRADGKVIGLDRFSDVLWLFQKHYPTKSMRIDISRNSSITMNVVSTAIQSAIYMGFSKIYLLGCDYNAFCSQGYGHCYDDSKEVRDLKLPHYNLAFYLKHYALTTEFHYLLRLYADSNNIEIINLTNETLLDAYKVLPLRSVIKKI